MELGETPEPGGTDDFVSVPTTPLSALGREIPHQLRAVSPMTEAGDDLQAEGVRMNDASTISGESSDSDSSFRDGSDAPYTHHTLTIEPRPRLRDGLMRANWEGACQDRVMVKRFGRKVREHRQVP